MDLNWSPHFICEVKDGKIVAAYDPKHSVIMNAQQAAHYERLSILFGGKETRQLGSLYGGSQWTEEQVKRREASRAADDGVDYGSDA